MMGLPLSPGGLMPFYEIQSIMLIHNNVYYVGTEDDDIIIL